MFCSSGKRIEENNWSSKCRTLKASLPQKDGMGIFFVLRVDKFFGPGGCFIAENTDGGIICSFRGRVIREIQQCMFISRKIYSCGFYISFMSHHIKSKHTPQFFCSLESFFCQKHFRYVYNIKITIKSSTQCGVQLKKVGKTDAHLS